MRPLWTIVLALSTGCIDEEALGIPAPPVAEDGGGATGTQGSSGADTGDGGQGSGNTFLPDTEDDSADGGGGGSGPTSGGGGSGSAAEQYAVVRCQALSECACPTMPFEDTPECEASMAAQFLGVQDLFAGADTDFQCFAAIVDFYEAADCETPLQIALGSLAPACALFTDSGAQDEACVAVGNTTVRADSCAEGLSCVNTIEGRRCRPVGDTSYIVAAGEVCFGEASIPAPCVGGHWCDGAGTGLCLPRATLGEACTNHGACDTNYCDAGSVCANKLPPGSSCRTTAACDAPLCQDGACDRPLCANGMCQDSVPQACLTEDL